MITVNGITCMKVKVDPIEVLHKTVFKVIGKELSDRHIMFDSDKNDFYYEEDVSHHGSPVYERRYLNLKENHALFVKQVVELIEFVKNDKDIEDLIKN